MHWSFERLTAKILIGTSGFGYSDWQAHNEQTKIPFYPSNLTEQQRISQELDFAKQLQLSLLPEDCEPSRPGWDDRRCLSR